jgi:nucleoside-diphosphate-sugar epimerase
MPKALVVGGTGPTGPYLVDGLLRRGFEVSIFHRGTHEIPEIPARVQHIHGDPFFEHTIAEALDGHTFDLVVATYGRIRFLSRVLVGKIGRLVVAGGVGGYRGYRDAYALFPPGLRVPTPESAAQVDDDAEMRPSYLIYRTQEEVLATHPTAAYFRYPLVYGPHQLRPREWSITRRALDKRPHIVVPDGGLLLFSHGYAENLAHAVLLGVDQPEASAGQVYNCADEEQLTLRQIIEIIANVLEHEWEIVSMPYDLARPAHPYVMQRDPHHRLFDVSKIRYELGYTDVVGVEEALKRTVEWYVSHPPVPGGEVERQLQDPFDYEGEDRLIGSYTDGMARIAEVPFSPLASRSHPYAHPNEPNMTRDQRGR